MEQLETQWITPYFIAECCEVPVEKAPLTSGLFY